MPRTFLPPRGILAPTRIIFHSQLPSAVILTWMRLRCLAWDGRETPPKTLAELASLIGIHPSRLSRHLAELQGNSVLSFHSQNSGKIIVSFPEESPRPQANNFSPADFPAHQAINPEKSGYSTPTSYFPSRILGYLSFDEDSDILPALDEDSYSPEESPHRVPEFLKTQYGISHPYPWHSLEPVRKK